MENNKSGKTLKILLILTIAIIIIFGGIYLFKKSNIKLGKNIKVKNPEITFNTNMGSFTAELYPKKAPNTVKNILALASSGYYNGKIIYGKDMVTMHLGRKTNGLQEDPTLSNIRNDIKKGSEEDIKYSIKGEFTNNNFKQNDLPHERYTLSIARPDYTKVLKNLKEQSYNAGCGNILIVLRGGERLNGNYAAFGKIIKGQDVVDNIEKLKLQYLDKMEKKIKEEKNVKKKEEMKKAFANQLLSLNGFENPPVIKSVDIDTKGIEYNTPEYIKAFNIEEYLADKYKQDNKTQIRRGNIK